MKKAFVAVVIAAIVFAVISSKFKNSHNNNATPNDPGVTAPQPPADGSGQSQPAVTQDDRPRSDLQVTFRGTQGSDTVNCDAIDTEFLAFNETGPAATPWKADPIDSGDGFGHPGNILSGITVEPSSGTLQPGSSTMVIVHGSLPAPAKEFWVFTRTSYDGNNSGVNVSFTCQGR